MTLPNANLTVSDRGVGLLPPSQGKIQLLVGYAKGGTPNTVYRFTDSDTLIDSLEGGSLVEAAALVLDTGGGEVVCVPANASNAGTHSAVTASGGGPAVTLTGTPNDYYEGIVEILTGGAVATATFRYSLDGGDTWSAEILTAATYAIPGTSTVLNFAAGTYVAAETYSWTSTAPMMSTTDLGTALDVAIDTPSVPMPIVQAVGIPADAAASVALQAALNAKLEAAVQKRKYSRGIMQCADVADARNSNGESAATRSDAPQLVVAG